MRFERMLFGSFSGLIVAAAVGVTAAVVGVVELVVVAVGGVRVSTGTSLVGSLLAQAANNTAAIAIEAKEIFLFISALLRINGSTIEPQLNQPIVAIGALPRDSHPNLFSQRVVSALNVTPNLFC
jgi:hypothetical protein